MANRRWDRRRRLAGHGPAQRRQGGSRPVSRVLSGTVIHLGRTSPCASSDLPGSSAGHTNAPLFGLAPGGVYRAAACCHPRGALLPHLFTLTGVLIRTLRRSVFCGTFRRLAPPRRYLAPCPAEPGLSSTPEGAATVRPTPERDCTRLDRKPTDRSALAHRQGEFVEPVAGQSRQFGGKPGGLAYRQFRQQDLQHPLGFGRILLGFAGA